MVPIPTKPFPLRTTLLHAVCLAAFAVPTPGLAQQGTAPADAASAGTMRGTLARGLAGQIAPPQPDPATASTTTAYRPALPGAVPDDPADPDTDGTLFPTTGDAPDDTFSTLDPVASSASVRRRPGEEEVVPAAGEEAVEEEPGIERQLRIDANDEERNKRAELENARAASLDGLEPQEDLTPFAPLGLRLGTFTVTPTLETGITWTSNANYSSTDPRSAFLSESTLRLNAISDWSRHSAAINAFGTYRKTISGEEISEPSGGVDATLTLDILEGLRGIAALGYQLRPEQPDSPVELPATTSRPLRQTLTASAGIEKDLGKLRFAMIGDVERLIYGDADLEAGGTLSQEERNSTLVSGRLRVGYAVSPALTPFAEAEYGRRFYDLAIDSAGYARSADRVAARAGVALNLGEKLRGEVALGRVRESFDDARLVPIAGLSALANVDWSPQEGTVVSLDAETSVEGTTTAGESGSLLHSGTVTLSRQLRADLTLDMSTGLALRDYVGTSDTDLTWNGQAALTWWLNRYVGVTGRYRYEMLDSTIANRDSEAHSVYVGMRLQR